MMEYGFVVSYQTVSETSVMPGIYLDEIHLKEKAITEKKQQLVKENSKEKVLVLRHVPTGLGSMEFAKILHTGIKIHDGICMPDHFSKSIKPLINAPAT